MTKCGPFVDCASTSGKETKFSIRNSVWSITSKGNSSNLCYMIICRKDDCQEKYIDETKNYLKKRITQHMKHINNKKVGYRENKEKSY